MTKYDDKLKLKLVHRYLAGSSGIQELVERYGVSRTALQTWVLRFREKGAAGLVRRRRVLYSAQFKLSVLRRARNQSLSLEQVAAIYNVRGGGGAVARWQRQYDEDGFEGLKHKGPARKMPKSPETPPAQTDDARTLEQLREENADLRAEVAYLKKLEALVRAKRQAARKKRKPSSR